MSGPRPVDWRRKRKRRVLALVGGLLLVIGIITVWPRSGDSSTDELATSGFREATTTIDTSPFELLGNDGPTTIPDDQIVTTSTTRLEPTTTTSTTTTTLPPTTTIPPTTTTTLPQQSDPICQGFVELIDLAQSGRYDFADPAAFTKRAIALMTRWVRTLERLGPQTYRSAIIKLEDTLAKLRQEPTPKQLEWIMADLLAPEAFAPLVAHRDRVCPSVGSAF